MVNIKCVASKGAVIPEYKTSGAAGADICALLDAPLTIPAGKFAMVPTGLFFEIPEGYEVQIRPRSGLAAKNGVTVLNTPGTIDSDYRGEIKVILINLGAADFTINSGDRIAQMVVAPVTQAAFSITDSLSETERGAGGFGSTGIAGSAGV
jgi:dUTP pyrophosphatase